MQPSPIKFNALVTGGGGFLGSAIVRQLLDNGSTVRSFSRKKHPLLTEWGVPQIEGDISDKNAVAAAVAGCDIVFHVAAKAGIWGHYREYYKANVIGTENVIGACRQHHVSRLIYTSSPSVIFTGKDMEGIDESAPYSAHYHAPYPKTKAMAEKLILRANDAQLATVSLRPHLIWGPGDHHIVPRLVERARAGKLWRIGWRKKRIDTLYIDNAVHAHLLAAERLHPGSPIAGHSYFITQGEPMETWELVNQFLAAAGAPLVKRTVSRRFALLAALGMETLHRVTRNPNEPRLTRFVVREMSASHWFNISAARHDLGYSPKITIAEGLQRLEDYYRNLNGQNHH